ncbi:MAG TPA: phage BR0599 family protein [Candidatus Obscuribacterales bacterium]
MTYNAQEDSVADGQPLYLYTFARNGVSTVYLAASQNDEVYGGNTYLASEINHSNIKTSRNLERQELEVTVARTNTQVSTMEAEGSARVSLTISRVHRTDGTDELAVVWKGIVQQVRRNGDDKVFVCNSIMSDLTRQTLHARAQRTCRWVHYGDGCGLTLADFQDPYTASATSGNTVTLTTTPAAPTSLSYDSGILTFNGENRTIDSVSGTTVTLLEPFEALADAITAGGNQAITLAPGCTLNQTSCAAFGNLDNFGGFPYFPNIGAFDGRSIV